MLPALLIIASCVLYFFIYHYIQGRKLKEIRKLVAWCVTDDSRVYRYNLSLSAYVNNAQLHAEMCENHRILGDTEWKYVQIILSGFQQHLTQAFFYGEISHKKSKWSIPEEDFFMYHLFCYLSSHECEYKFLGFDMHAKTISYESHGSWGGPLFDAIYELTDFAIVVQKLRYITFLSCKTSLIYKDDIAGWLTPEHFTDMIDTKQIHISRV